MKVDPEPMKAQIKVEAEKIAQVASTGGYKIKEVNGAQFIVHEVKPQDSLPRLSLIYNVPVKTIKNVNSLFSDQIF